MALPSDYTGLVLWLKADAITGLSDGASVATWTDSSGAGNNATQATSARQPIYKTGIVNGQPVVRYGSGSRVGMITTLNLVKPYTIMLTYAGTSPGSNRRALQGQSNNWLMGPRSDANNCHAHFAGGFTQAGPVVANVFVCLFVTHGAPNVVTLMSDMHNMGVTTQNTDPGVLVLGGDGAFDEPLNGDIAEVIVYNRILDVSQWQPLRDYLASKYALISTPESGIPLIVPPRPGIDYTVPVSAGVLPFGSSSSGGTGGGPYASGTVF